MQRTSTLRQQPALDQPLNELRAGHGLAQWLPQWLRCAAVAIIGTATVAGCAEQITVHGHQFREADILQVQPGMGQEQVRMSLGSPTTTSTTDAGSAYYYISSTKGQTSFFKPVEKDRQVVAIYFAPTGTVDRVANYGLKDGKVFDYASGSTPAPGARDEGLVKQLFRNLGTKQIFGE